MKTTGPAVLATPGPFSFLVRLYVRAIGRYLYASSMPVSS